MHAQTNSYSGGSISVQKGRGAVTNASGRFERYTKSSFFDGWSLGEWETGAEKAARTEVTDEWPKSILTKNISPDVPFDRSINPYRGCEHGCVYCFARPAHTYMGLSAGQDFEQKLFAKKNAAELLEKTLARPNYFVKPIALGTNTDPYQPLERERKITRSLLEVMVAHRHPFTIVTKSRLILRDLDLLAEAAAQNLVRVFISVTTLDPKLARMMEPRAATPQRRLETIHRLVEAGVKAGTLFAPVIPAINDHEMEAILSACVHAGADKAAFILLRLPNEVKDLFRDWLEVHFPDRSHRVLNRLAAMRGGRLNDPRFGNRMRGEGIEAELLRQRFYRLSRRLHLSQQPDNLRLDLFSPPTEKGDQLGFQFM